MITSTTDNESAPKSSTICDSSVIVDTSTFNLSANIFSINLLLEIACLIVLSLILSKTN